jgi:hypothetical protein
MNFGSVSAFFGRVPGDNDPRHGRVIHQGVKSHLRDRHPNGIYQVQVMRDVTTDSLNSTSSQVCRVGKDNGHL